MAACLFPRSLRSIACLSLLALVGVVGLTPPAESCCPAGRIKKGIVSGEPVVNADQAVIILWDAANKTQHFIRRASFVSEGDDFGFLVPTPAQPVLAESGNDAFPYLQKLTEPEHQKIKAPRERGGMGCAIGCGSAGNDKKAAGGRSGPPPVKVLEEKVVAGFKASVLETTSTEALVNWLKANDYAFSPEVAAWAKPYVEGGWKITAMKVVKGEKGARDVAASALRMSFKTDRPLFPYREPDFASAANQLKATSRLLRIYFLAEARYGGAVEKGDAFGEVAWANKVTPEARKVTLEKLGLPEATGPAEWWLTEFEHRWPYRVAPGDVFFSRSESQDTVKRPPIIEYVAGPPAFVNDVMVYALLGAMVLMPLCRRRRRDRMG